MRFNSATAICLVVVLAACKMHSGGNRASDADTGAASAGRSCATSAACAPGEYCAFEPHLCGKGKRPGACRPKPTACNEPYGPVCGCDKMAHNSECAAHAEGVDLAVMGGCPLDIPDWSICGPRYCDARTTYCEIVLSDVFELPTDYTCRPLPPSCIPEARKARDCSCFPSGTPCLSFCGYIDNPGLPAFHLTCRL